MFTISCTWSMLAKLAGTGRTYSAASACDVLYMALEYTYLVRWITNLVNMSVCIRIYINRGYQLSRTSLTVI